MKNTVKSLSLLSLALVLGACGNSSTVSTPVTSGVKAPQFTAVPGKWFVELEGDPTALSVQSVGAQQAVFRAQAAASGIRYQEVMSFDTLFNGFSVQAEEAEVNRLSLLPGVRAVYPVEQVERPVVQRDLLSSLNPDMMTAVSMTGADIAQNELGLTGKGVKVAVMDTGIDLEHPAFKNRVVAGYDFVGDAFGTGGNFTPKPDDNPDDCGGHGTHVAGIVGGADAAAKFKGVAPDVTFGAYKVFGCDGSTSSDIMIAAMERAYKDGMHILNMSIGASYQWPEYPSAKVASRLVKQGMVVTVSAGNSGTNGQWATGAPSLGENVIATASVDNTRIDLSSFTLSDGSKVGFYAATGSPVPTKGTTFQVTKKPGSTPTTTNDGCTASGGFAAGSLTGKAALIRRGSCTFYEKAKNAQDAGATAVILYNNVAGYINPTVTGTPAITIPVVSISAADGAKIDGLIATGASFTFDGGTLSIENPTSSTLSSFTSYGMSPDLELKPDLAAPGGSIKSAYPLTVEPGGYAVLSGTSMAAPHAAGVAALMLQAYPTMKAKDMRARLMNTASLRKFRGANGVTTFNDYVQRQGAGMIDVIAAHNATVSATPSKLSLGESDTFATRSKVVVLKNTGATREVFTVKHAPALTVAGTTLAPAASTAAARMTVNGTDVDAGSLMIEVAPFSEVELNVTVTPPASAPDKAQYGGYLSLQSKTTSSLVVPYSGFKGDYQSIEVLGRVNIGGASYDFPALYDAKEGVFFEENEAVTTLPDFTMAADDQPSVLAQLSHQAQRITLELLDGNGNVIEQLGNYPYVGRNATNVYVDSTSDAWDAFGWDGKLKGGSNAPNGTYQLRLKVLKALGDESNPKHTETYTSQKFTVKRP